MDFSETIIVYDLKLATDDRSDKEFLLHQNYVPRGLSAHCHRAIYMYLIMNKKQQQQKNNV